VNQSRHANASVGLLLVLALVVVAGVLPASAGDGPDDRRPGVRIIGGTEARPGAWPWQAALVPPGLDPARWTFCGGTVIAASWVLTAEHCVAPELERDEIDVLTGQSDLSGSGGQRLAVAEIVRSPTGGDIALLRLDQPTTARPIDVVRPGQESLWSPGTDAVATGWGTTVTGPPDSPDRLRQVTLPVVSDADCAVAYPGDGQSDPFDPRRELCAGDLAAGGRGTCQGDSGGPLMVPKPGGGWVQVGITSWSIGCAEPGQPDVYARVAAYSTWVERAIRYGPFASASEFVDAQYRDILGRAPTAGERTALVSRLDGGLAPDTAIEELLRSDASFLSAGSVVRLYYGYFDRDPETEGLQYWIDQRRRGIGLDAIGAVFSTSPEFQATYGRLSDGGFVDLVYRNVLHRAPDAAGRRYWVDQLGRGVPRWAVMMLFTDSSEHKAATEARVLRTTAHAALMRTAPTTAWLDLTLGLGLDQLLRALHRSAGYAARF
jgi:hypothetical protein